jgi:ribosomal protein S18 acetylase RimI-like enzyme
MQNVEFKNESARCILHIWDDKSATVSSVHSVIRNQGHATGLMKKVTDYADEHGLALLLDVNQFGHPIGPDNAYLIGFYQRFGFEILNVRARVKTMRRPSQEKHAL